MFQRATVADLMEEQMHPSTIFKMAAPRQGAQQAAASASSHVCEWASADTYGRHGDLALDEGAALGRRQFHEEEWFHATRCSSAPMFFRGDASGPGGRSGDFEAGLKSGDGNHDNVSVQRAHQQHHPLHQPQVRQRGDQGIEVHANSRNGGIGGKRFEQTSTSWSADEEVCGGYNHTSASSISGSRMKRFEGVQQQQRLSQFKQQQQLRQVGRSDSARTVSTRYGIMSAEESGCGERGNSNTTAADGGWRSPGYSSLPPNGRPRSRPRVSSAPVSYSSPAVDGMTQSPSPRHAVVYARGGQRSSPRISHAAVFHGRSFSEGHHNDGEWISLTADSDVAPPLLPAHPGVPVMQGPHSRAHSDGAFIDGRWQNAFDPGGGVWVGGSGGKHSTDGHISSPDRTRMNSTKSSSQTSVTSFARHGFKMTHHPVTRHPVVRDVDCPSGINFSDGAALPVHAATFNAPPRYGGRDSPTPNMVAVANEQQRRRLAAPAMPGTPPGFTRSGPFSRSRSERKSSTSSGNGGNALTVTTPPATAGADRVVSPDMAMNVGVITVTAAIVQHGRDDSLCNDRPPAMMSSSARGQVQHGCGRSSPLLQQPSTRTTPPPMLLKPPSPRNPMEWLQGLHRTRRSTTAISNDSVSGSTTPPTVRDSSVSSMAPSPAHGGVAADGNGCLLSPTAAVAAARTFPAVLVGRCLAPDCPCTGNCLPDATPDMLVFEVKFKRATRTFLPSILANGAGGDDNHSGAICCGDRVKVTF